MASKEWTIKKENELLRRLSRDNCKAKTEMGARIYIMNEYIKYLQDKLDDNTIPFELIDTWENINT